MVDSALESKHLKGGIIKLPKTKGLMLSLLIQMFTFIVVNRNFLTLNSARGNYLRALAVTP
jgi:hypothetical protein